VHPLPDRHRPGLGAAPTPPAGASKRAAPAHLRGGAGTFANYPVHLSTDFQGLRYVYVIREKPTHEVRALEDSIRPNE